MKINPNDELAKLVNKVYAAKPADALFVFDKEKIDKISASVKTITEIMHRSIDDLEVEIVPDELLGTCLELRRLVCPQRQTVKRVIIKTSAQHFQSLMRLTFGRRTTVNLW